MRRRPAIREDEDVTGLAGWMYSDLLLGLMVVFLATISFIPMANRGQQPQENDVAYSYARVHPVDFRGNYSVSGANALVADVEQFKREQGLGESAYVTKAQFIGTYNPATETGEDGMNRALAFSSGIDVADGRLLTFAATVVRSAQTTGAPRVTVRFTFASEVSVVTAP